MKRTTAQKIERFLFWSSLLTFLALILIGVIIGFTEELLGTVKTITLLQYTSFLLFTFLLEKIINKYKNWILEYKSIISKLTFLLIMALFYEVLWIFFFWFSNYNFYGIDMNIDTLEYEPHQKIMELFPNPINLNIWSKIIFLSFFLTLYFFYRISKLTKKST